MCFFCWTLIFSTACNVCVGGAGKEAEAWEGSRSLEINWELLSSVFHRGSASSCRVARAVLFVLFFVFYFTAACVFFFFFKSLVCLFRFLFLFLFFFFMFMPHTRRSQQSSWSSPIADVSFRIATRIEYRSRRAMALTSLISHTSPHIITVHHHTPLVRIIAQPSRPHVSPRMLPSLLTSSLTRPFTPTCLRNLCVP